MQTEAAKLSPAKSAPDVHLTDGMLSFRGESLFSGLHLTLDATKTTCLLGPSGVGKSSLLRLLAGLGDAAMGEVKDGNGKALQGRLSYMAQQDLLLPWLTTLENVCLGARLRASVDAAAYRSAQARARELLKAVGLSDAAGKRPFELSGGMRQRAALARTLFENQPFVLMDEPFSAVDAITRLELQELAADLLKGRTVLLVTHDPLEALRLGDLILIMSGRPATLETFPTPAGQTPRSPQAADLLAAQSALLDRLILARGQP